MEKIKQNLPVLLFLSVVPYMFYNEPTLPQALIAAVISGVAAFKYYLESKELPDYVTMFKEKMEADKKELDAKYHNAYIQVMEELEKTRLQNNVQSINKNIEKKINLKGW